MNTLRRCVILVCMLCVLAGCAAHEVPQSAGEVTLHFCHLANCADVLSAIIKDASSLSCAFYTIDGPLRQELIMSGANLIVDEDAGLALPTRTGEGLMHNKFCIINESIVATGSYNPSAKQNFDNLIIIRSVPLASQFQDSFDQLLEQDKRASKRTLFRHNGYLIESYACPQDECQAHLKASLAQANVSIRFALFTFTDKEIADLLIKRYESGVAIDGVVESYQSRTYAQYDELQEAGIPVLLERSSRLQHNKVFVIDNDTVVMGSYNPTKAANTINDEHILIIHDKAIAQAYDALIDDVLKSTQSFK